MKRILRFLIGALLIFLLYVIIVLVHGTLTDFQPEERIKLPFNGEAEQTIIEDSIVSFMIWNIGYAGLGEESSFFYDKGGMLFSGSGMVRPPKEVVEKNQQGILNTIQSIQSDFYLIQEVDIASKRSYFTNQYEQIGQQLKTYASSFGINYKSARVPLPILEPWHVYGKVESGLASYSKFQPILATRFQLPGTYDWPTRLFQLDRCAMESRFKLSHGKELVVYNIHNSAYDKGGKLKAQQMAYLKAKLLKEFAAGNYVVAGGDWNQCPPYFPFDRLRSGKGEGYTQINISPDFLPANWRWVFDARTPTNRKVAEPFNPAETFITVIDFFVISPNIRVIQAKGIETNFQFSDHQPVWMEIELL